MKLINKTIIKELSILLFVFLLLVFSPLLVSAHSGGTDSNGGHYDHSTGEYHYHHGYPAHQHREDGSCPYEDEDPYYEKDNSGGSNSNSKSSKIAANVNNTDSSSTIDSIFKIIEGFVGIGFLVFLVSLMETKNTVPNVSTKSDKIYHCPVCGAIMVLRDGKYGKFYGCSNYPACYGTRNINGKASKKRKRKRY